MPGSLGGLVVSLGLNAAEFSSGLTKAEREAQKFAANFSDNVAAGIIKAQIALEALSAAATLAVKAIPDLIDQAGHFQDLAEKTGASAEELASLSIAAKVAGVSMDDLATFSIKLSKNLSTMDEESSKTAAALSALGIPIKEFKALDPAAQIERLARALKAFSDIGGGKAAALEAIAKGGAQLLPFLKELEEGTGRQTILTNEAIKRADEFSDAQKRSAATLNAYAQVLAIEFAPAITAVKGAITEVITEMLGLKSGAQGLPTNEVRSFAESSAIALAHMVDVVRGVGVAWDIMQEIINRTGFGAASKSLDTLKADLDAILQRTTFADRVKRQFEAIRAGEAARAIGPPEPPKPTLKFNFNADATARAAREQKAVLDQQLKNLNISIGEQKDALSQFESSLGLFYQNNLIGLREFYQSRSDVRQQALERERSDLAQEIRLLEEFRDKQKGEARTQAQTRVDEAKARLAKTEGAASQAAFQDAFAAQMAFDKLADSVNQADIALKQLQGDTVSAGLAAFDAANTTLRKQLDLLSQSARPQDQALAAQGDAIIAQTRKLTDVRLQLDKVTKDYSLTLEELGISQQRIDIAQQTGNLTTLEGLRAKSDLAARYTIILREQLAAAEAVAAQSGRREDIVKVQQLQVQLEALAATGDLVAKQFQQIFVESFAQGIEEAISGTKSLKDAFLDMARSIERAISRIAAQNIAEKLFGGTSGAGFDISKLLSLLFAGATGGTGAGWTSGFDLAGAATGGTIARGGLTVVGEQGPEVVNLPRGAQITSNQDSQKMFGPKMNFVINVLPGASTATAQQAAAATGIAVQRAMVRNT